MKKILLPLIAGLVLIMACNKLSYDVPTPAFAKGADVSWVSETTAPSGLLKYSSLEL